MEPSESASQQQDASTDDIFVESEMNLAFLDPPRFGWSATGGVVDVLPPHDRARRSSTRKAHVSAVKAREKRSRRRQGERSTRSFQASGTDQLEEQMMAMQVNSKVPPQQDGKPAAVEPGRNQNGAPPAVNGITWQQLASNFMPGAQAATATSVNHSGSSSSQQQQAGVSLAAQGIKAVAAGLTSLITNMGESAPASLTDGASTNNVAPQKPPPSEATMARINDSTTATSVGVKPAATLSDVGNESTNATSLEQGGTTASGTTDTSIKEKGSDNIIKVKALNEDGVLDMYTYHRGREGLEPRDDETGKLLCDVDPTDTNHGWEPPNLKIAINISFPLSDGQEDENEESQRRHSLGEKQDSELQYRETIEWDLADPKTATPMCFATNISEEYGLDAGQTLDLAMSIQKQINYFFQNKVAYQSPLTLLDANGNVRRGDHVNSPNMRGPPQLFGSAIGETKAGMPIPQRVVQPIKPTVVVDEAPRERRRSSTSSSSVTFTECKEEVLRRAKEKSAKAVAKKATEIRNGELVSIMEDDDYTQCHACKKRRDRRIMKCVCDNPNHVLCSKHVSPMIGMEVEEIESGAPVIVDHCPICAWRCECQRCALKLKGIAQRVKNICTLEGLPPKLVVTDDLLEQRPPTIRKAKLKEIKAKEARKRSSSSSNKRINRVASPAPHAVVPKVPVSDFPREVCGGRDVDPGTKEEYRTVYTAEGAFLRNDIPEVEDTKLPAAEDTKLSTAVPPSNGTQEDGNVDYCHTCMKHGNLLCCDFCPRAFHRECITSEEATAVGDTWQCFVCHQEKDTSDADVVTGESSLDLVLPSFVDFKHSQENELCVQILSLIHETISKLMDYDFGSWFREPVDCGAVPNYRSIVKNPMDLGTIASRIVSGEYAEMYKENRSWDDVLVAVLRDIELVWHNCFTFNFEGSSIYRMAQVQRRKYLRIREKSFDCLLSPDAKKRVDEFVSECERQRGKMTRVPIPVPADGRTSNGRHKITVGYNRKKTSKRIGVLDPDTGMVVKMYSTMRGAVSAADFLVGLGHPVEHTTSGLSEHSVKKIFQNAAKDPKVLLFGYRWLYMEDLVNGNVKFGRPEELSTDDFPPCTVEVKVGDDTFAFLSVEEAILWPGLLDEVSEAEIRQQLLRIPYGEWTTIAGLSWRKTEQETQQQNDLSMANGDAASTTNSFRIVDLSENSLFANFGFVKEDLLTRRALIGFENAMAAYADWLKTREGSPVFPVDEPTDFDYFTSYYLDGERNVDGVIWRTVPTSGPEFDTSAASNAATEDVPTSNAAPSLPDASTPASSHAPGFDTENDSRGSVGDNEHASASGGDPVGARESAPPVLQEAPSEKTNGHFALHNMAVTDTENHLGAKRRRTYDNASLDTCRPAKKTAVCYS